MNYYNPYFYTTPNMTNNRPWGRLFSNFSLSGFLNGTQKVLNFANQAIPFVRQVKPIIGNAKTMFKVMSEFKRSERVNNDNTNKQNINSNSSYTENSPKFFL